MSNNSDPDADANDSTAGESPDTDQEANVTAKEATVSATFEYNHDPPADDIVRENVRELLYSDIEHLTIEVEHVEIDGIRVDSWYVTNGDETFGPYAERDVADVRAAQWNCDTAGAFDGPFQVESGDVVLESSDIPVPDGDYEDRYPGIPDGVDIRNTSEWGPDGQ